MQRSCLVLAMAALTGCAPDNTAEQGRLARAVHAGLNAARALPGGGLATFSDVVLIGDAVVCGRIDGQDGSGPRRFSSAGGNVTIDDPRDPTTLATVQRTCVGTPRRPVTTRNPDYLDITVEAPIS